MQNHRKLFRCIAGLLLLMIVCAGLLILNIICGSISISFQDFLNLLPEALIINFLISRNVKAAKTLEAGKPDFAIISST